MPDRRIGAPAREVLAFPLRTASRRRDILAGGLLFLCVPILGWILNLGHRWRVMERLYLDDPPWFRGFRPLDGTFARGIGVGLMGLAYLGPGAAIAVAAWATAHGWWTWPLVGLGIAVALMAFHAFPFAMARFAQTRDPRWLVRHAVAYRAALRYGAPYVRMWIVTWSAITISVAPVFVAASCVHLLGWTAWAWLLALPFPFLSPWAWSALGYGFGTIIEPTVRERDAASLREGAPA